MKDTDLVAVTINQTELSDPHSYIRIGLPINTKSLSGTQCTDLTSTAIFSFLSSDGLGGINIIFFMTQFSEIL